MRPGAKRLRFPPEAVLEAAAAARLQRERYDLLLDFARHLDRTAWEAKTASLSVATSSVRPTTPSRSEPC